MLIFIIPLLVAGVIILISFFNKKSVTNAYFFCLLALTNIGILLVAVFQFQIFRSLSFIGALIALFLVLLCLILSLAVITIKTVKEKRLKNLSYLAIPVFSLLLSLMLIKYNVSERMALYFEFPKLKNELALHKNDTTYNNNIRIFGKYVGIMWDWGFLDNYSVIVYDESNMLDIFYKSNRDEIEDKKAFDDFSEAFKYEKLADVYKIEDNYYRCNISE